MIQFIPPHFVKDQLETFVSGLIASLQEVFAKIEPQLYPGTIVLWPTGVTIPGLYLECNGNEYQKSVSPALYKLLGESTPGNFAVPTVTAPAGSVAVIRV